MIDYGAYVRNMNLKIGTLHTKMAILMEVYLETLHQKRMKNDHLGLMCRHPAVEPKNMD